ncbi:hypothetical protein [Gordonia paraffinivorans]|uniref:hypothetical protein n=1 Tax=Gordonia paraffinivorans TaxID=175628 RepID=UPI001445FA57|nr:hypothetical protein [Gordonia paraffinivorans]
MKIVYLHGVGTGDPEGEWLVGLNQGLESIGAPPIYVGDVIAPRYAGILNTTGVKSKHPDRTYNVKNDHAERRAFERRQARVQRMLGKTGLVQTFGFARVPGPVVENVQRVGIGTAVIDELKQVKRYMTDENVRAAVLSRILDEIPPAGDILLIGHSLGSVIAIDLLDHLPPKLHVRRFITIGSPAGSDALHEGSERILKRFPYARVDDWSNFLDCYDPVTAGRGLSGIFNGAQDFGVTRAWKHSAHLYLKNPAIAQLVSDVLNPSDAVAPSGRGIVMRLDDAAASSLLTLKYAHHVASLIDKDRQERYEDALAVLQDKFGQELLSAADASPLPPELADLAAGRIPVLPRRWDLPEAVSEAVVLAFTNVLDPYEIDAGDARIDALIPLMMELGYPQKTGKKVADAVREVSAQVTETKRGLGPKARIIAAAAGIALLAAGPVGIAMAGAAGAAGAAAIVSGLAAFGPGGMVGGLAMLGGLASTGAMVTTVAATARGGAQPVSTDPTRIAIHVAIAHALNSVDEPYDETLWHKLAAAETELAAELNRLSAFSDHKAPSIEKLRSALAVINRLMAFMVDNGLSPRAIPATGAASEPGPANQQ